MNWKKLQNGSDIRGVALEGIEGEHVNLTPDPSFAGPEKPQAQTHPQSPWEWTAAFQVT